MENLKTNSNIDNNKYVNFFTKLKWGDYEDKQEAKQEAKQEDKQKAKQEDKQEDKEEDKEEDKQEDIQVWETQPKQELFKKIVKKHYKKQNIPIVYELKEFIECLNEHKKPNIDFIIDISAHCDHTYKGTLCKNIKNCKKIHIQRCTKGNYCENKRCSYIHKYDMPDEKSQKNFDKSINTYNKIKPNKKVIQ